MMRLFNLLGEYHDMNLENDIINAIININKNSSKDATRYAITGVCLDVVSDRLRLRATNGYALSERLFDLPESLKNLKELILEPDSIKLLKMFYGSNKRLSFGLNVVEESVRKLKVTTLNQSILIGSIDMEFPDTQRVKPQTEIVYKVGINPKLLLDLCESMRDSKRDMAATLEFQESGLGAVKVSFGSNSGVIMPCRVDGRGGLLVQRVEVKS